MFLLINLKPSNKKKPKKVTIEICFRTSLYEPKVMWFNSELIFIEVTSIKIKAEKEAIGKRFKGASI